MSELDSLKKDLSKEKLPKDKAKGGLGTKNAAVADGPVVAANPGCSGK